MKLCLSEDTSQERGLRDSDSQMANLPNVAYSPEPSVSYEVVEDSKSDDLQILERWRKDIIRGNYSNYLEQAREIAKKSPNKDVRSKAYFIMALIYMVHFNFQLAKAAIDRAIDINPTTENRVVGEVIEMYINTGRRQLSPSLQTVTHDKGCVEGLLTMIRQSMDKFIRNRSNIKWNQRTSSMSGTLNRVLKLDSVSNKFWHCKKIWNKFSSKIVVRWWNIK